jgi:HAE1 family hydrophobic/amphiphilic exporter-1
MLLFPVFDLTINMLSLIGFVMVSGMLVDDAIIVIENIYRHIEEGESVVDATINGTNEVMWPVIAAIATTMAAFIPMLLISGTSGEFMSILPKTVIVCLIASLVECLFVLPAHYIDWGSRRKASEAPERGHSLFSGIARFSDRIRLRTDQLIDRARDTYLRALGEVLQHKSAFLTACVAAFYFSCGLSSHVPTDLFPNDFNQLFATVEAPVDYSIEQTNEVVLGVQRALDDLADELTEVTAIVGQGMGPDETPLFGSNYGLFFIGFRDSAENNADPTRMLHLVRETLDAYRRANPTGIENLIVSAPRNGPPIGKPVATRIVTEDYDLAKRIAAEVKLELSSIAGVYNITDNMPLGKRELQIGLDEYRASVHGLAFEDLGIALRAANDGIVPTTFKDPFSDEDIDIRVMLPESQRRSADYLLDIDLRTPEQYLVKLGDVSTVAIRRGFQRLYHYDGQRALVVYADVDPDKTTSVLVNQRLAARFADIPSRFPGASLVLGGEYEETNQAFEDMGRAFVIALIAIYAILAAQFRSYLQPLIVMCVIVFAYVGVVIGMYVWDYAMSMYVIYAMVGLAGVVVNDSLVLIDFVNRERERGTPPERAVLLAGQKRFRAVLLTTLTTVAGLLPMATGISGVSVVFGPFAAAIVVGLSVASGLTLFVVPTLYLGAENLKVGLARRRRGGTTDFGPAGAAQPS